MTPATFLSAAAFLSATTAVTVLIVGALAQRRREPSARSPLWRTGLAAIALLVVGESTGLFTAGGAWLRQRFASADKPLVAREAATEPKAMQVEAEPEVIDDAVMNVTLPELDTPAAQAEMDLSVEQALAAAIVVLESSQAETATDQRSRDSDIENRHGSPVNKSITPVNPAAGPTFLSEVIARAPRWSAWLWTGVAVVLIARNLLARAIWCWRYRDASRVTDREIRQCVSAISRELGLRRRVAIYASPRWVAPVAWGVWRPSIGLPEDFQESFTRAEQDAMLAHELGHLAARDPAWQCLADGVTALLWWAPWCWWLRKQMRIAAEWMADEASLLVAEGPQALAECLVTLGRRMAPEPTAGYAVTGSFRSNLGKRVTRLLELAESSGDDAPRSGTSRWRTPALVVCVVMSMVAGSAWARSGIESTQGAENMRVFEQSWRRSLAGGVLSLALGAPTSAVLAQEGAEEPKAEVAVEEQVEDADDAEEADDSEEVDESEEADEAEESEEDAEDEGILAEIAVEVEQIADEVGEELEGALGEVSVEIEEALAEIDTDVEEALADVDVEIEDAMAEVDLALEEVAEESEEAEAADDDDDDDEADSDDADHDDADQADQAEQEARADKARAEKRAAEAKEKVGKALKARDKAMVKLKKKMEERRVKQGEKARKAEAKMMEARDQAVKKMDEAQDQLRQKLAEARERGDKNAPQMEEELQRKLQAMQENLAEQQQRMQEELQRMQQQFEKARMQAEEQMAAKHRDEEARLAQRLEAIAKDDQNVDAVQFQVTHLMEQLNDLRRQQMEKGLPDEQRQAIEQEAQKLADEIAQLGAQRAEALAKVKRDDDQRHVLLDRQRKADDELASARSAEAQARRKMAFDMLRHTASQLRDKGQVDSADEIEQIAKLLADEGLAQIVVEDKRVRIDESRADVDQLRGEVSSLRGEIAELRDMLKQSLQQGKDAPPRP